MKTYQVRLPITGVVDIEVEADNEAEAIDKALDQNVTTDDITEWETHRQIVKGNIFYGHTNEAEVEESE